MKYSNQALSQLIEPTRVHRKVYLDPDIFDLEMARIWGSAWIYIGHESQVKTPGEYATAIIGNKVPVIMVRDKDGKVHVLHNRCGHKGAKLVDQASGKVSAFRCCYHGWTYRIDGKLVGVPNMPGYEGTGFNKNDPQYSMQKVAQYGSYRGFVFATLDPNAPDLNTWMGTGMAECIDNMCDRSPEGEVEVVGKPMRYEHDCNWKMFTENLNDGMHPMVVHQGVVDAALQYMKTVPEDSAERTEAEIIPPFGASYEHFESTDLFAYPYGHHYDGGRTSIHAAYSVPKDYEELMIAAYGEERTREILTFNSHNTMYYPSLTTKTAVQNIRVVRPISVNKTIIESWSFRLKGAPESMLKRTILYSRLINSSFGMVGPDDLTAYHRVQNGLESNGSEWVEMHRHFGRDEDKGDHFHGLLTGDLDIRTQYKAWKEYMTKDQLSQEVA
ncbi:MAG: aromatic ring-hydroxylating dioxygenase subunit alpha [Pseudomonadales bacterium]